MPKFPAVLALSGALCACAGPQATTADGNTPATSAETRVVCETVDDDATGTRLGSRECRTVPVKAKGKQTP